MKNFTTLTPEVLQLLAEAEDTQAAMDKLKGLNSAKATEDYYSLLQHKEHIYKEIGRAIYWSLPA